MRIQPVEKEQASEDVRAIYDEFEQRMGRVPNFFRMLAHKPEILRTFNHFYSAIWSEGALPAKLKELAYLRTSILNGCDY